MFPSPLDYPSPNAQERAIDRIVHVIGFGSAVIGGAALLAFGAWRLSPGLFLVAAIYVLTLLLSKTVSALYHTHPSNEWRAFLRRLDQAAIYGLIAGTFTPLLVFMNTTWSHALLVAVWVFTIPGVLFKLFARDIDTRWSLASYLAFATFFMLALPDVMNSLPGSAVIAMFVGGLSYIVGTWFFSREAMPYRFAIWHGFVLVGSGAFFLAIWLVLLPGSPAGSF